MKKQVNSAGRQVKYDPATQHPLASYFSSPSAVDAGMEEDFEREFGQDNPIPSILKKLIIAGGIATIVVALVVVIACLV